MVGVGDMEVLQNNFCVPSIRNLCDKQHGKIHKDFGLTSGECAVRARKYVGEVASDVVPGGQGRSTIQSVERQK